MTRVYKPGEKVPRSGQYEKLGPRGGHTDKEVTAVKGKVFPPASGKGYELSDKTKHKR